MNIVERIRTGDQEAFETLFHSRHEQLYHYVLKHTASHEIAEEVVQQAFVKLWLNREKLNPELSDAIQLFRIARTTMIDAARKRANEKKLAAGFAIYTPAYTWPSYEEQDLNRSIHQAIDTLPPVRKKVFKLSRQQGLSYAEIAHTLSISVKTVESHISKAIRHIKEALQTHGFLFFLLLWIACQF